MSLERILKQLDHSAQPPLPQIYHSPGPVSTFCPSLVATKLTGQQNSATRNLIKQVAFIPKEQLLSLYDVLGTETVVKKQPLA